MCFRFSKVLYFFFKVASCKPRVTFAQGAGVGPSAYSTWLLCSGLLLKPARGWWRIISDKFKSQLNSESLEVKFLCNCCKYWFSLLAVTKSLWHQSREELHWNRLLSASQELHSGQKLETFGGEKSGDKVSLKQRLLRITFWQVLIKEKHSLPVAAHVSWTIFCKLIIICQQHFSQNNAWPSCIDPLAWPG